MPGRLHGQLLGIAVDRRAIRFAQRIGNAQQRLACQFVALWRTKADGVRHALALGHAVMRPARRQVQHVAGLEHIFLFGHEVGQNLHRHAVDQRLIVLSPDAPAPLAVRLQQKHVIAVEVRAHAAAVASPTDHQIVKPCLGHKAELVKQRARGRMVQVHALHQQRPLARFQRWQAAALERPVAQLPAALALLDQA
ncbi:hypothetical protein SDC9_121823 [bioreactor metagenome]|uniref:Uncharacterized protein n=1 Tax=bioreactor metagenome TaxID=1076179 RepID=A0A645CD30_9ZZZZ